MLRYRRKYLFGAACAGAVIVFVPALVFIAVLFWQNRELQQDRNSQVAGYQLKKDMQSGELLQENCLEEIRMVYAGDGCGDGNSGEKATGINVVCLEDLCGKRLRFALKKGTVLSENFLYEGDERADDLRSIPFSYIASDYVKKDDYVDVRIRYENGMDFIVLSKKKIRDVTVKDEDNPGKRDIWMQLTEEEQLRMSCAAVDAYQKKKCSIYAVQYVDEAQNAAVINYPLSEEILTLMKEDPNILEVAQNYLSRQYRPVIDELEDRVYDASLTPDQTMEEDELLTEESPADEIIYFDN